MFARDETCIVDVRDLVDGTPIPIKKSLNKYIVKCDTIRAITDQDYFVKMIDLCEKNRVEEVQSILLSTADNTSPLIVLTDRENREGSP
jgi:hypothetical protein